MKNSLPRCNQCNSPVTDSIEVEIENHGKIKLGKNIQGSWICNDCALKRDRGDDFSPTPEIQDESNSRVRHEHIGIANKADVSPNTPTAEEADVKPDSS
jgi:uncharacterized protein with PIN domain